MTNNNPMNHALKLAEAAEAVSEALCFDDSASVMFKPAYPNAEIAARWGALEDALTAYRAAEGDESHFGWLYWNPDTGEEWSPNHPIESGEIPDAERVRAATAEVMVAAYKDRSIELVERAQSNAEAWERVKKAEARPPIKPLAEGEMLVKLIEDFYAPWGSWKTAWWESEVGNDESFGPDALLHEIKRRLSLQPSRPQGEWHEASETPSVPVGDEGYFIVAVRRAHSGKVYSFPATYLNAKPLDFEDEDDARAVTGWYGFEADEDNSQTYHEALSPGDELMAWHEIPQFDALSNQGKPSS